MAWNEPGGSNKDQDPWGKPGNTQGPPDLDEVVRKLQAKLAGIFGGRSSGGGGKGGGEGPRSGGGTGGPSLALLPGAAVVVLLAWGVFGGLYVVGSAERGVVTRFGAFVESTQPGLHWNWPAPMGAVDKVNVDEIRTVEIGFRSGSRGQKSSVAKPDEALMLTRDENIVDIEFAVQYRVKDAAQFVFKVVDPEATLQHVVESAVREIVGKSDMDFVITEGRGDIQSRVATLTQETLDRYETGLLITAINMQNAQPPEQVQDVFDDVVKAREDEQRLKNEAEAYANDIIPKARGAAARQNQEASAYKEQVIAQAQGEAARFAAVVDEYKKAPDVTKRRLYLETMEQVYGNTSKVVVDVKGNNVMILPLDKLGVGVDAAARGAAGLDAATSAATATANAAAEEKSERAANSADSLRSRERR